MAQVCAFYAIHVATRHLCFSEFGEKFVRQYGASK